MNFYPLSLIRPLLFYRGFYQFHREFFIIFVFQSVYNSSSIKFFHSKQRHEGGQKKSLTKFYLVKCLTISKVVAKKLSAKSFSRRNLVAKEWLDPIRDAPFKNHNNVFLILVNVSLLQLVSSSSSLPLGGIMLSTCLLESFNFILVEKCESKEDFAIFSNHKVPGSK